MSSLEDLNTILDRIVIKQQTEADLVALRQWLAQARSSEAEGMVIQQGKYNVNLRQGQEIHIGDRTYQGADAETIHIIIQSVLQKLQIEPQEPPEYSVDDLVPQVRSRLRDDIQCLHGTMPLWGVDHWVPLGALFVDVNILEEVSGNRRSELDDLWQDFNQNPGYRGLDRMGLGKERQRVSGLEVLNKNTNLMVVGKPGSGKTTYLQRVVTECNDGRLQAQRIPSLIRLREFVDDGREIGYSVERYLEQCWRLSEAETKRVLDEGRSLLLLDGLDEVTGKDGKAIAKQIKRFARDYPQVQVIVTCRTQSQESRFERFDYVEVADFNEAQVRSFSEHWFQTVCADVAIGETKAKAFLEQLFREENKPIRELAITPILLSLTCAVFYRTEKFYSKRSKLYEEALELLLEQWDKSRTIERDEIYRDLSGERKLELLSHLALKKFEQEQYVLFEQAEIEGYIGEFLGIGSRESRAVLRAIESQHGLLIERATKVWSFSHLTFQEYLVAKWFFQDHGWQALSSHVKQRFWREVFLLVVEMEDNPEQILYSMKEATDDIMSDDDLQDFLMWLNNKATSIQTNCKSAAIRALYLSNLDPDIDINHNLPEKIDSQIKGIILDKYAFDTQIDNPWEITLDFALHPSRCPDPAEINIALNLYPEFGRVLIQFSDQVSERHHDRQKFSSWWQLNGEEWNKNYRTALIQYRNICHEYLFDEFQRQSIEIYCYANGLIMDCFARGQIKNKKIVEEIGAALLLPIAEIEKCKREEVE